MSKTKLLLDVIGDLRSLADSLQAVADVMCQGSTQDTVSQPEPQDTEPQPKRASKENKKAEKPPAVTLEDIRAVLSEKSRNGHTAEVRGLIKAHGADRLPDIDPAEYPALLAEAEAL